MLLVVGGNFRFDVLEDVGSLLIKLFVLKLLDLVIILLVELVDKKFLLRFKFNLFVSCVVDCELIRGLLLFVFVGVLKEFNSELGLIVGILGVDFELLKFRLKFIVELLFVSGVLGVVVFGILFRLLELLNFRLLFNGGVFLLLLEFGILFNEKLVLKFIVVLFVVLVIGNFDVELVLFFNLRFRLKLRLVILLVVVDVVLELSVELAFLSLFKLKLRLVLDFVVILFGVLDLLILKLKEFGVLGVEDFVRFGVDRIMVLLLFCILEIG